jgi:predicted RNase H-like HicB family nuclease
MTEKRFNVTVRRDPDGESYWLADAVGAPGARTFGRSLSEAKRHAVEVVALWHELEPDGFELDWAVRLGKLAAPVKTSQGGHGAR